MPVKQSKITNMKRGQEVICIDDTFMPPQIELIPNRPVEGKMYTIRDVFTTRMGKALHLEEITNPNLDHPSGLGKFEPSFSVDRFRRLVEEDVQISVEQEEEIYA
jgi:hypothetical protein